MSNHLAIATVTAVLADMISSASGAATTTGRPPDPAGIDESQVNLFLYQVTPNPHWRNADLPTRRGDGSLAERPQIALDLHYLLTFYGAETELIPQQKLGLTMSALHARPILSPEFINKVADTKDYLKGIDPAPRTDLADQIECVRLSPLPLSLEELSKLWSVFFQTPYALSVAYQASVVLIEAEELPSTALPVQAYGVYALPFRQPEIEQITIDGDGQLIVAGSVLVIHGRQLSGNVTKVRIGEEERVVEPETAERIELKLPDFAPLRAGIHGVQVVHELLMGSPAKPHRAVESNVAAIVLHPEIIGQPAYVQAEEEITLDVQPPITTNQRVILLLNSFDGTEAYSYRYTVDPDIAAVSEITISTPGAKAGEYYIRIQVDGAESPLWGENPPRVHIP